MSKEPNSSEKDPESAERVIEISGFLQNKIDRDLAKKVEVYKKPRKGYNSFMFGYNKQGICGQQEDNFIKDPSELKIG